MPIENNDPKPMKWQPRGHGYVVLDLTGRIVGKVTFDTDAMIYIASIADMGKVGEYCEVDPAKAAVEKALWADGFKSQDTDYNQRT